MATAEPWQKAEIAGPTKALVITKPEVVVAMIKKAKRPLLIVGHEAAEIEIGDKKLLDHAIYMGMTYYFENILFSSLKHYSQNLKTISLDRYYHPNASWAFPNLPEKDWD